MIQAVSEITQDLAISDITILIDTREQAPYSFTGFHTDKSSRGGRRPLIVQTRVVGLQTGITRSRGFRIGSPLSGSHSKTCMGPWEEAASDSRGSWNGWRPWIGRWWLSRRTGAACCPGSVMPVTAVGCGTILGFRPVLPATAPEKPIQLNAQNSTPRPFSAQSSPGRSNTRRSTGCRLIRGGSPRAMCFGG